MAKKALPCPTLLRQLLRYEPETGKLFWRERAPCWFEASSKSTSHNASIWNARYAGKEAMTAINAQGYHTGSLIGGQYRAHRIIWAIYYGSPTRLHLDHINGDRLDNRIENLREVTQAQNSRNMCRSVLNRSGVTGVRWNTSLMKWRAQIGFNGATKHIGVYDRFEDAVAARKAAEKSCGFDKGHGKVPPN